jgi:UDP-N-acetylmuramoyl-L-alanyl-D-glutamate--2,6-diaminopimelate ligase
MHHHTAPFTQQPAEVFDNASGGHTSASPGLHQRLLYAKQGKPLASPQEWLLKELVAASGIAVLKQRGAAHGICIQMLCTDSRRSTPGSLFFAIPGGKADGHHYVDEALARGAVAVVAQKPLAKSCPVPWYQVADVRLALAQMARVFFHHPQAHLRLSGVTGTNGKTTVTTLARALLQQQLPSPVGCLGTLCYHLGSRSLPAYRTLPDALSLYQLLAHMHQAGCKDALLEVTSHGIVQQRAYGLDLHSATFLNLTQDHLDYHASLQDYFEAKASLFTGALGHVPRIALVNLDDPWGAQLCQRIPSGTQLITFSCHPTQPAAPHPRSYDHWVATDIVCQASGSSFVVRTHKDALHCPARSPLIGHYNVSNALASLIIAHTHGCQLPKACQDLAPFAGVPGRLQPVHAGQAFTVLVDYAHTEDALCNVLCSLRPLTAGRLLVVFGCGGDRDKTKRPAMMRVVQTHADACWVTSDNPRHETPEAIFQDMRPGIVHPQRVSFQPNRELAIQQALAAARAGDTVLIAGKGHETYQQLGDTLIPFDDRRCAKAWLEQQSHGLPPG